jgi:hypothetical protein
MNVNGTGPGGTGEVDSGFDNGTGNTTGGGSAGGYGGPGNPSSELPMPQLNSFAKFN